MPDNNNVKISDGFEKILLYEVRTGWIILKCSPPEKRITKTAL